MWTRSPLSVANRVNLWFSQNTAKCWNICVENHALESASGAKLAQSRFHLPDGHLEAIFNICEGLPSKSEFISEGRKAVPTSMSQMLNTCWSRSGEACCKCWNMLGAGARPPSCCVHGTCDVPHSSFLVSVRALAILLMGLAHKALDGGTQEVILCSSVTTFWNYFKIWICLKNRTHPPTAPHMILRHSDATPSLMWCTPRLSTTRQPTALESLTCIADANSATRGRSSVQRSGPMLQWPRPATLWPKGSLC